MNVGEIKTVPEQKYELWLNQNTEGWATITFILISVQMWVSRPTCRIKFHYTKL